jgi:sulfur relay (sulfurtransferase) complex TusBCD TusD component (DsrE family)
MTNDSSFSNTIVLLTKEGMGTADASLQRKLLDTYLRLIIENNSLPAAICFYTDGVKLVVEGSLFLERLSQIEKKGVRLIICLTCLDFFGLSDKVRVGIIGSMADILDAQIKASKVITL